MSVRAIVFDAYGTLYDVHSVRTRVGEVCGAKAELVTQLWRLKQLEYTWLRSLMDDYEDFWSVTRSSLAFSLDAVGVSLAPAALDRLAEAYLDLQPQIETREALVQLKDYRLAILSNGNPAMLDALVKASGLEHAFSDVISVDRAKIFKPNPRAYQLVETVMGVATQEVLFVSSNSFDVAGAKRHGFKVAWIERGGAKVPPANSNVGPPEFYRLLRGGAEYLGYAADYRIKALTDLKDVVAERV